MENWKIKLRRTNVIQTEFGILPIRYITFGNYYVQAADRKQFARTVEPVQLTEQVILNLGFKKDYDGRLFLDVHNDIFSGLIRVDFIEDRNQWLFSVGRVDLTEFKNAHDLQNIYLDLTGEQLEYKPIN